MLLYRSFHVVGLFHTRTHAWHSGFNNIDSWPKSGTLHGITARHHTLKRHTWQILINAVEIYLHHTHMKYCGASQKRELSLSLRGGENCEAARIITINTTSTTSTTKNTNNNNSSSSISPTTSNTNNNNNAIEKDTYELNCWLWIELQGGDTWNTENQYTADGIDNSRNV